MIAVAAMAVASQAASVKWQLSPTKADGFAAGQTALLFLGTANETFSYDGTDGLSLSDYVNALLADGTDTAAGAAFDSATTTSGRSGVTTEAKTQTVSYAAGTDIVGMIVVLDGNGKYIAFSLSNQVGAGDTPLNTGMPTATSPTGGSFVDLPTGGSGQQIPEPATGALALAGLALLFKRRRA
jgi:hypothetical protein